MAAGTYKKIDAVIEFIAVLTFAVSSFFMLLNVVNRYVVLGFMRYLSSQFDWFKPIYFGIREIVGTVTVMADELPGLFLVWITLLGAYLALRKDGHIAFDALENRLPRKAKLALIFLNYAISIAFFILLLWQSVRMIYISGGTEIETADISQGWFMLVLPMSAILITGVLVLKLSNICTNIFKD